MFGVWCLAFGVRRSAFGGWRSAVGVWRLAFGGWRLAFGGWRLAVGGWRLAFGVRRLAFGVWRLAFGVRRLAFGVRRSDPSGFARSFDEQVFSGEAAIQDSLGRSLGIRPSDHALKVRSNLASPHTYVVETVTRLQR